MSNEAWLQVVHSVPGRMRLRLPESDRNPASLREWEDRLRRVPGVSSVQPNTLTGALVVLYDPAEFDPALAGLRLEAIVAEQADASAAGPLAPVRQKRSLSPSTAERSRAPSSDTAQAIARTFWRLDREVYRATNGKADLKLLIPGALLGAGVWELLFGAEMAGVSFQMMAWYAYNIFYQLHPHDMQGLPPDTP